MTDLAGGADTATAHDAAVHDLPHLDHVQLLDAQRETLATRRRTYGLAARVPYQAWEQVAYIAVTHVHRRIHDRVLETRSQQDNEQWHLLVRSELIAESDTSESRLKFYWLPQLIAFGYYQLSWLLYVIKPAWSYRLNADFEDHAEHEYMELVAEHPEWEETPFTSSTCADYGQFDSVADVLRQIGHDERIHNLGSIAHTGESRFR